MNNNIANEFSETSSSSIIDRALGQLLRYVEEEDFKGWDPYDYLNSFIPFRWGGKWVQAVAVQAGKLIPFNLRQVMGIKKGDIPKGLGLLLNSYCILYQQTGQDSFLATARLLFKRLLAIRSKSDEYCWGCNFVWANPHHVYPKYYPSVVVTSFVGFGIYRYYTVTNDEKAKEVLLSIDRFIHNELSWKKSNDGLSICYTGESKDYCYNASIIGALMLSLIYQVAGGESLLGEIRELVRFVIGHQHQDGHWAYSLDPDTGKEYEQIDFHQGFILVCLKKIKDLTKEDYPGIDEAIDKGLAYYRKIQFTDEGVSLWRVPKVFPVEIHNQAQGIITFSMFAERNKGFKPFAEKILMWTIENMRSKKGYFIYRKFRLYSNRIPFMRWSQAWMLLALVYCKYLTTGNDESQE